MTYTSTTRDRYRLAVWTATAAVAAGAITATGWVAGAAAHEQAQDDAERQAEQDAQARQEYDAWLARYGEQPGATQDSSVKPRTVVRTRPVRTRVTTRYVTATAATATVGTGGTVGTTSTTSQTHQTGSSGSSTPTQTQAQPQNQNPPPPPPPPPPPAPTSGS